MLCFILTPSFTELWTDPNKILFGLTTVALKSLKNLQLRFAATSYVNLGAHPSQSLHANLSWIFSDLNKLCKALRTLPPIECFDFSWTYIPVHSSKQENKMFFYYYYFYTIFNPKFQLLLLYFALFSISLSRH